MKTKLTFLLTIVLFSFFASVAQITITANDFPHAGMLVVRNIDTTTTISPGLPGTGQIWDFSNLTPSVDDSTLYILPEGLPNNQSYPQSNLVAKDLDSDINYDGGYNYIYYNVTPSGWLVQGQEMKFSFWGIFMRWHMAYQPPVKMLPLPLTFNSSNDQSCTWRVYAASGFGTTATDSSCSVNHMTVNQLADASGTMITPEGSHEVLRVFQHMITIDSTFNYDPANGWIFSETNSTIQDSYWWYANGIGEIGYLNLDGKKGGGSFSYFKSSTIVGTNEYEKVSDLKIFPVPATDILNIESSGSIIRSEIYNQSGALQLTENDVTTINISTLVPGTYFIKVFTPTVVTTRKFIKQ
jgi:hypothetical protein